MHAVASRDLFRLKQQLKKIQQSLKASEENLSGWNR